MPRFVVSSSSSNGRSARAFWVRAPGIGEIRSEVLDARGREEVLVRALYSGISRGTEALVFSGKVPRSQHIHMRAPFQTGDFSAPVKYGYASVGVVEEGSATLEGRTVFCLYPHQSVYVVPACAVCVLPASVPPGRAVLAANMETALNAVWDARPVPGDRLSVVGGGTVGCLLAWLLARIPGTEVQLVDVNPARERVAQALGVAFALPPAARGENDLVFHASGAPAGLPLALRLAGFEAEVWELSWYADTEVSAPFGEAFHSRRLSLRSSQVGAVAPARRARATHSRRLGVALALLADARLDVLITGESPLDALPEVMARLAAGPGSELCHRIKY
ncbi:MAG: zinc-dependent alcohol dehydrogenase [Gammaproteobacteria bacterium]